MGNYLSIKRLTDFSLIGVTESAWHGTHSGYAGIITISPRALHVVEGNRDANNPDCAYTDLPAAVSMERSEISVSINRPLSEVFAIYTQADLWSWTDFRSAWWTHGQPWARGSRLRVEPKDAYGIVVDQVLTHFEVNRLVGFISHFGGITMQSQTHFRPLSEVMTEVISQSEFVGTFSRIASFPLRSAIEFGARRFLDDLKRECEREDLSKRKHN